MSAVPAGAVRWKYCPVETMKSIGCHFVAGFEFEPYRGRQVSAVRDVIVL